MKYSNLFKVINKLPEIVREILYLFYLIFKSLNVMKVFFNPHKKPFVAEPRTTDIPVETDNGIVHKAMSDDEIAERHAHDNALELDPAYLASKGVEPKMFGGSVLSAMDAHDGVVDAMDDFLASMPSSASASSQSAPASAPSNETETANNQ